MEKKYQGVATIELRNKNTGEVNTIKKHNLVTNAVKDILEQNPFMMKSAVYKNREPFIYPNVPYFMSGIALYNRSIPENVNSKILPAAPDAWAGNTVNSTGGVNRGSFNFAESGATPNGFKLVWDFNSSQANGTFNTLCLTNPDTCNGDFFANGIANESREFINGGRFGRVGFTRNSIHPADLVVQCHHYDEVNGYFYRIESSDFKTITIHRCERGWKNIPITQAASSYLETGERDTIKCGKIYRNKETATITFSQSIIPSSNYVRVSTSYYDGKLYIFSLQNNQNVIYITELDLATFGAGTIEGRTNKVTFTNATNERFYSPQSQTTKKIVKDLLPFKYPYLCVQAYGNANKFLKININNTSDYSYITAIDPSQALYNTSGNMIAPVIVNEQTGGCLIGNFYVNDAGYCIDFDSGKYWRTYINATINSDGSSIPTVDPARSSGYSIHLLNDSFLCCDIPTSSTYSGGGHQLTINPFYMATINNVPSFTKTSADTMKITYIVTETSIT